MSHEFWMIVSGTTGFICFVIIHFTKLLSDKRLAAYIQLSANTFVFISWGSAFLTFVGTEKLLALIGTMMPIIFGSITFWRVFVRKTA